MRIMTFMQKNRWTWSAAGVVVLWLVLAVVTGRWSVASLSGILVSASFLTRASLRKSFQTIMAALAIGKLSAVNCASISTSCEARQFLKCVSI